MRLTAVLLRHDIRDTGRANWRPAPLRWRSEVGCPARLDRHCPRRAWAVCPLALYNDSELGIASLLAHQSPGAVSPAGRADLSPADAGEQPHRPAVGRSCYLLCNRCSPTAVHPPGALGPWLPRTLACGDRPALHAGRCGVVWTASLDRVWVQRQQTGWVALGADQDARPGPGRAPLVSSGGRHLVDRQCGLPGRRHPAAAGLDTLARAPYCSTTSLTVAPVRSLSCFRRGRLMIVAALCTEQALPLGQVGSEPWPQSPTAHDNQAEGPVQRAKAA